MNCAPCNNPATNETYHFNDTCIPEEFLANCPNCPEVTCQFTKYLKPEIAGWMQWYNLFALYWGMCFASALGKLNDSRSVRRVN